MLKRSSRFFARSIASNGTASLKTTYARSRVSLPFLPPPPSSSFFPPSLSFKTIRILARRIELIYLFFELLGSISNRNGAK